MRAMNLAAQKKIVWTQQWTAKCPYDRTELKFRTRDRQPEFFYECPSCSRQWDIQIRDGKIVRG